MAYPQSLISQQSLVCSILVRVIFSDQICTVSPGDIFVHQCSVIFFKVFFHPDTAHFFYRLFRELCHICPAVSVGRGRSRDIYHTHLRPIDLNVILVAGVLHAPCNQDNMITQMLIEHIPFVGILILLLNGQQCTSDRIGSSAYFNKQRPRILRQNPCFNQLGSLCDLCHLRGQLYIADNGNFP